MSSIFFLPIVNYVPSLKLVKALSILELCEKAEIPCLASGDWIYRQVEIRYGRDLVVEAEPGDWGRVRISMPKSSKSEEAKLALVVLAYSLHDLVAKQSIRGKPFAKIPLPKGRIRTGKAMTNSERQRLHRERALAI